LLLINAISQSTVKCKVTRYCWPNAVSKKCRATWNRRRSAKPFSLHHQTTVCIPDCLAQQKDLYNESRLPNWTILTSVASNTTIKSNTVAW